MATQSLYRRYRPRRFADLRGQDHVVRVMLESLRHDRVGHAYLFSGPRGTGKTSSARILAKALNCTAPVDGEPCCECDSCLAVERGTSYDVHELDAASNSGVDNVRELIERAALASPGRQKVYILDEVHMLSRNAEAALLKTLEEPPAGVVFVLATTDPQKVSETIRSRTQQLQFHLLGPEALAKHVRWVAADAGIDLPEAAFDEVVRQGNGSVRDSLSALELMASTGGEMLDRVDVDAFTTALTERDTAAALQAVASATMIGYEARPLTELLVRHLRDGFLALMAPDLVMLPAERVGAIAESARMLGPAALVRAIERLGTTLVEMRSAPDPRLLLEVALIQLTHDEVGEDLESLSNRLARVENQLRAGGGPANTASSAPAAATAPVPVDPTTNRAQVGGRARRTPAAPAATPTAQPAPEPAAAPTAEPAPAPAAAPEPTPEPAAAPEPAPATATGLDSIPEIWASQVRGTLKPFVRALYAGGNFDHHDGSVWYFSAPSTVHADKCQEHLETVEQALSTAAGFPVRVVITSAGSGDTNPRGMTRPDAAAAPAAAPTATAPAATAPEAVPASVTEAAPPPPDRPAIELDEIPDPDELTDVPPEDVPDELERIVRKFPGSELIESDDALR